MSVRRKQKKDGKRQVDHERTDDDILAPNSDTECEQLSKRIERIAEIARHVGEGGELYLISTALRGPIEVNPWKRKEPVLDVSVKDGATLRTRKRQRKAAGVKNSSMGTVKDGKVDQYFPAQKNSQERDSGKGKESERAVKKYAVEADHPIISDDAEVDSRTTMTKDGCAFPRKRSPSGSPYPVKAVPRIIDFDRVQPSASIPSSNFPSLQIIRTHYEPAQRLSSLSHSTDDSIGESTAKESSAAGNDCLRLVDAPIPERNSTKKALAGSPTEYDIELIRDLVGDPSQKDQVEDAPTNLGLFDGPTPPLQKPIDPAQITSPSIRSLKPSPNDFTPILPASITRCSHFNSSPTRSPLEILSPLMHLNTTLPGRRKKGRRLSSSSSNVVPHSKLAERIPFQRSQTHDGVIFPAISATSPLNTQALFDRANESFNNAVLPTITPTLLPSATLHPANPRSQTGFTPFKDLNRSPTPREPVSFRLASVQGVEDSPLAYSPVNQEALWNDIKGILRNSSWDLGEDVDKAVRGSGGGESTSHNQSQECIIGA